MYLNSPALPAEQKSLLPQDHSTLLTDTAAETTGHYHRHRRYCQEAETHQQQSWKVLWDTARTWEDEEGQGKEILAGKKMEMAGWKRTAECFKRPKGKLPLP